MLAAGTLGSYSTITATAQARTPTSRFIFDGDEHIRNTGDQGLKEYRRRGFGKMA